MRFVLLLIIAGFSPACVPAGPSPDTESPMLEPVASSPQEAPKGDPWAYRSLMTCEWGCPALIPFVNTVPVFRPVEPDVVQIEDVAEDPDLGPLMGCGDVYDFSVCCGDDVCQASESAFFCPADCF